MKDRVFVLSNETLLNIVKHTQTLEGRVAVYEDAQVSLEVVDPSDLKPTAKYVLRENLERVNHTRQEIKDLTDQDMYYEPLFIKARLRDQRITLAPPVVEEIDGEKLIVDGIHRCFDSLSNGRRIAVVMVRGVKDDLPPIGLPVSWEQVRVCDTKPETASELRNLHPQVADDTGSIRKYFRDYGRLGSSGRRPRLGQYG